MEIKLVKQEGTHDCAAACIAMSIGLRNAKDVYPMLGYDPSTGETMGVYDWEVLSVLHMLGRRYQYFNCHPEMEDVARRISLVTGQALAQKINASQKGCWIVGVPSLNNEGGGHFVLCHKGEIYDPTNKLAYHGSAASLDPLFAIYIEEH